MASSSNIKMATKKMSLLQTPLTLTPQWSARDHTCIRGKQTCFALDADGVNGSCLIRTDVNSFFYMDSHGNVGINTTAPTAQMHIVSNNGACLRMTHNVSKAECDLFIDSSGNLTLDPDGAGVTITKSLNIVGHTGTAGLYLRGALVTSSATQLNYTNTTEGVAQPSKALITDQNKSIHNVNELTLETPLDETSGGTGHATYTVGDILVADTPTSLTKLSASSNNGDLLVADTSNSIKMKWGPSIFQNYVDMGFPKWVSAYQYGISHLYCKNDLATNDISISSMTTIGPSNILKSAPFVGTIFPDPSSSTIIGTTTAFQDNLIVGDVITVATPIITESRRVVSIQSNSSITIDTPFTLLNKWDLVGATIASAQKKFGTSSLSNSNSTTQYAKLQIGTNVDTANLANAWTIEFNMRLNAVLANLNILNSSDANGISMGFTFNILGTSTVGVSLGNTGSAFNIASNVLSTVNIAANTWYHVALVFTGTAYVLYINGVAKTIATSTLKLSASTLRSICIGGNGTTAFNGYVDEFRVSNVSRYTGAFTPPTSAFVLDANTISLQHFDASNISDECTTNATFKFYRGGSYGVSYLYALNTTTGPTYALSHRSTSIVDLPSTSLSSDLRRLNFFITYSKNNNSEIITRMIGANKFVFTPAAPIVRLASNISMSVYDLSLIIPINTCMVDIMITHYHTSTNEVSIIVGDTNNMIQPYLPMNTSGISQLRTSIPIIDGNLAIIAYASGANSTYTIDVIGVSVY
jgi:Concanavalin A-like lectin/glucanases superfamily